MLCGSVVLTNAKCEANVLCASMRYFKKLNSCNIKDNNHILVVLETPVKPCLNRQPMFDLIGDSRTTDPG